MYYFRKNGRSKIIHTETCHHKARILVHHLGIITNVDEAAAAGYCFCKCCDPLRKQFQAERKDLLDYEQQHGLSVYRSRRGIKVTTPRSRWMIVHANNKVGTMLYHRNDFPAKASTKERYLGYHDQKVCYSDLRSYLNYIVEHDYYRMMHPLCPAPTKKAPPQKGTKRYKKAQKQQKKRARSAAIRNVLELIDSVAS